MLDPLLNAGALPLLIGVAVAMGVVFAIGRRVAGAWHRTLLRVLAVAGFVVPGWTVFRWYRSLARVRDATASLPLDPEPMAERFVASSAVLLATGFALLVGGVYLARRLPGGVTESGSEG